MISRLLFSFVLLAIINSSATAQNTRINERNLVGWWACFATFKLSRHWGIHSEYQWRRENFVTDWQQSVLRVGLNYLALPNFNLRAGYAWIETFAYGDYPINGFGRDFTEYRAFQMATLTDKLGRLDVSHRFMLEQRWIGRYTTPEASHEDEFFFVNRMRYMLRIQCPLKGKTIDTQEFYVASYNEILIGFGKNVNENVFDQNRTGLLLGYFFNKKFRIEAGYLNQILQLPREILLPGDPKGHNLFQHNSGLIVNAFINIDWSSESK